MYRLAFVLFFTFVSACTTRTPAVLHQPIVRQHDANIMVFIDGTRNDPSSKTNISNLYESVSNQGRDDIEPLYIKGVGTDWRFVGAVAGWGIRRDALEAYAFLADTYQGKDDKIFLFGFSRGSFTARVLAGFIHSAGLPDVSTMSEREKKRFLRKLYKAYTVRLRDDDYLAQQKQRKDGIDKIYERYDVDRENSITVDFVGLWDTVGATGAPNFSEAIYEVRERYLDQICNISEAHHAVSLDDNRARIFTPVLMTYREINKDCSSYKSVDDVVNEVWFSGAHSDVGGGYKDGSLHEVSWNWMVENLKGKGVGGKDVLPSTASVQADVFGIIHDVEDTNTGFRMAYNRRFRDIERYRTETQYNRSSSPPHNPRIKLHKSVIERFHLLTTRAEDNTLREVEEAKANGKKLKLLNKEKLMKARWYKQLLLNNCMRPITSGFTFNTSCKDIEIK